VTRPEASIAGAAVGAPSRVAAGNDPAVTVLWLAASAVLDPPSPSDVREVAARVADRAGGVRLAGLAAVHRLSPLVWRLLDEVGATDVLGPAERDVADLAAALRAEALLTLPRALALAVGPLAAAGFEPVVLKGPAVAARYPAPGLRPMDDLDLFLPRRQHGAAVAYLEQAGWQVVRGRGRERYDSVLRHPALAGLPLELHEDLQGFHERATTIDAGAMWRRRRPVELDGQQTFVPAREDEVLMLAAHAAKPFHTFLRLVWAVDLALVVAEAERSVGLDWELLWRRAQAWRCRTALGVGLHLARRLGGPVPDGALGCGWDAGRQWRRRAVARILDPTWPAGPGEESTFHLRFALADTWWRRVVLLAGAPYQMSWGQRLAWPAVAGFRALRRMRVLAARPDRSRSTVEP
jgi:hypothetical protein